MALSSPTWTISTLVAFYIIFPFLLPTLQTLSTRTLYMLIILMYQVQSLPYILAVHLVLNGKLETYLTHHPLYRLPLFIMGISAALIHLRGDIYSSNYQGLLHDGFPWKLQAPSSTSINAKDNQKWA